MHLNRKSIFNIIFIFFLFFFVAGNIETVFAAVVINEVLPKTDDVSGEWIELYNNGSDPISLDRWSISNTSGTTKTFMMNASATIQPKNFLLLNESQTGITLNKDGDTIKLLDEKNNAIDSQSYPGILGYNTSMGRTTDGAGVWATCTIPTPNQSNNCPMPTSTPVPPTPIPTVIPTPLPSLIPTLTITPSLPHTPTTNPPTPIPLPTNVPPKQIPMDNKLPLGQIVGILGVVLSAVWMIILITFALRRKRKSS